MSKNLYRGTIILIFLQFAFAEKVLSQAFRYNSLNTVSEKKWARLYKHIVPENFVLMSGGKMSKRINTYYTVPIQDTSTLTDVLLGKQANVFVNPFAISKYEVTNKDYRKFIQWVVDSIALTILAQKDSSYYLNTNSKDLNWARRNEAQDSTKFSSLYPLYTLSVEDSKNKHTHYKVNPKIIIYAFRKNGIKSLIDLPVYPDTLVWLRDYQFSYNEPLVKKYFNHIAYNDYPVVGVTWNQAIAYCDWLSRDGKFEFRLPTSLEFQNAYFPSTYSTKSKLKNKPKLVREELIYNRYDYPWSHYALFNRDGKYMANFGSIVDKYDHKVKDFASDNALYTSKSGIFPTSLSGLYDLAGNVSEWVSDTIPETYTLTIDANAAFRGNKFRDSLPLQNIQKDSVRNLSFTFYSTDSLEVILEKIFDYYAVQTYSTYSTLREHWNAIGRPTKLPKEAYFNASNSLRSLAEEQVSGNFFAKEPWYYDEIRQVIDMGTEYYRNLKIIASHKEPRAVMGGSFFDPPLHMCYGVKQVYDSNTSLSKVGFRVVADVKLTPKLESYFARTGKTN